MQTEIIITNILQTKTAFGMIVGKSESVFIPGRVAECTRIKIGQTVTATLVPNTTQPDKTPWLAVFIDTNQFTPTDTLAAEIKADLDRGPATAHTISRSIKYPLDVVEAKLREMSASGDLASAMTYALTADDLVEEDEI